MRQDSVWWNVADEGFATPRIAIALSLQKPHRRGKAALVWKRLFIVVLGTALGCQVSGKVKDEACLPKQRGWYRGKVLDHPPVSVKAAMLGEDAIEAAVDGYLLFWPPSTTSNPKWPPIRSRAIAALLSPANMSAWVHCHIFDGCMGKGWPFTTT